MRTITIPSEYAEYNDFGRRNEDVPTCLFEGAEYVGVRVSPRGFANESSVTVARADDALGLADLMHLIERDYRRQPGDSFNADWMRPNEIVQHLRGCRNYRRPTAVAKGGEIVQEII